MPMKLGLQSTWREEINKFNLNFLLFSPQRIFLYIQYQKVYFIMYTTMPAIYLQQFISSNSTKSYLNFPFCTKANTKLQLETLFNIQISNFYHFNEHKIQFHTENFGIKKKKFALKSYSSENSTSPCLQYFVFDYF